MKPCTRPDSQISRRALENRSPPSSFRSRTASAESTSSDPIHTAAPNVSDVSTDVGSGNEGQSTSLLTSSFVLRLVVHWTSDSSFYLLECHRLGDSASLALPSNRSPARPLPGRVSEALRLGVQIRPWAPRSSRTLGGPWGARRSRTEVGWERAVTNGWCRLMTVISRR